MNARRLTTRRARRARRIAQAVRLSRRWIPLYDVIPLRLLSDPDWRERHILAPRDRALRREWDRNNLPPEQRGATR